MTLQDIVTLSLVFGFLIISVCTIFITYYLIKALKSVTNLADSVQNTTQSIREKLQLKFVSLIPSLVIGLIGRIFKKRG